MTAPTPLERLEQALAELGALTPDGIADLMRAKGIKGVCGHTCDCALARYLRSRGFDDIEVGMRIAWVPDTAIEGTLGDAVAEFRRRFDAGVYLDLVEVSA